MAPTLLTRRESFTFAGRLTYTRSHHDDRRMNDDEYRSHTREWPELEFLVRTKNVRPFRRKRISFREWAQRERSPGCEPQPKPVIPFLAPEH
jgi:hypothetical protein